MLAALNEKRPARALDLLPGHSLYLYLAPIICRTSVSLVLPDVIFSKLNFEFDRGGNWMFPMDHLNPKLLSQVFTCTCSGDNGWDVTKTPILVRG